MQKKIILIHEDPGVCDQLRAAFVSHGYAVFQVRKSDDASSIIHAENPDAVIVAPDLIKDDIKELLGKLADKKASIMVTPAPIEASTPESAAAAAPNAAAAEKLKEFQNLFLVVKAKYARSLPKKVEELSRDIESSKAQPDEKEALETVRQVSHKLVGTAGSYGYEAFAMMMRTIEQSAIEISKTDDKSAIESLWQAIEDAAQAGRKAADEIAASISEADLKSDDGPKTTGPVFARVLVVDEDEAFLDVVEHLGRQSNVAIIKAPSEGLAMNAALMHQLDAAIIDVKEDSQEKAFKLAIDLRSLPGYDTLPLAFLSAEKMRPSVEAAHVGASLHLDKPLDANALEAAVRHLVAIRQGGRPKVMVVDDDPDFTAKIAFDLRNDNLLVRTVHDPLKLLEALQEFPPDVMLLDVMMPGMNGFQVCQMLRGMPRWRDLPIIFITAEIHIEARVKAFTSGADDYLPKPVVTEELLARVRVRLEKSRLLKERSDKDTITGLLLRRAFVEQFNSMLADCERNNSVMSVCLMDVDHFKKVNDTYGHIAGDSVLSGFGQLLLRRFRVDDLRGRWGGEEFIIAFRREDKQTMCAAINRVQDEFSKITFESEDNRQFHVSFSGGIASYPDDGATLHELLSVADKRLYNAKHAGRRRIFIDDNSNGGP
ncbi:MAG: diguanylate cyclase [Candidatus Obscuribacterales bacterium]|jgi:diguanylate cyclase (GGDEF)-like protein|nr:diguanylate cyclase [Candidatus Obscuribacterales bacterium]